jgi:hypothetical protein
MRADMTPCARLRIATICPTPVVISPVTGIMKNLPLSGELMPGVGKSLINRIQ